MTKNNFDNKKSFAQNSSSLNIITNKRAIDNKYITRAVKNEIRVGNKIKRKKADGILTTSEIGTNVSPKVAMRNSATNPSEVA